MSDKAPTIIDENTTVTGILSGTGILEVRGTIEGETNTDQLVVQKGGRIIGRTEATSAQINGTLQGEANIEKLISIGETGEVSGKVTYGAVALAAGGELDASMHNVPPTLTGDRTLSVSRGKPVLVTERDLNAFDPDDAPTDIIFRISSASNGFVALADAPTRPVNTFTQADLLARKVAFTHDGSDGASAGFAVQATDRQGATSGAPARITVNVVPGS